MNYKKAYHIVRNTIFVLMIVMFLVVDTVVLFYHDYALYFMFLPIEALFVLLWWVILVLYNNNSVVHIETKKGHIKIITLGKDYETTADKITVKNALFFHHLLFSGTKLRANKANKSVKSFLYKYQNIYKTEEKAEKK